MDLLSIHDDPRCTIAAVCDVAEQHTARARERIGKCDVYGDFRHILDRDDIDAVLIATPDHWHAAITVMACQAGKDVYCEKPLCRSIHEGRRMIEAAQWYDRVVQMGRQLTGWPDPETIRGVERMIITPRNPTEAKPETVTILSGDKIPSESPTTKARKQAKTAALTSTKGIRDERPNQATTPIYPKARTSNRRLWPRLNGAPRMSADRPDGDRPYGLVISKLPKRLPNSPTPVHRDHGVRRCFLFFGE